MSLSIRPKCRQLSCIVGRRREEEGVWNKNDDISGFAVLLIFFFLTGHHESSHVRGAKSVFSF